MPIPGTSTRHHLAVTGSRFTVQPWYRQFYLRRGDAPWASDQVSNETYEVGVEAIGGFVVVGTEMYGSPTEVVVEADDEEPPVPEHVDRSVEVSIAGNGPLAVLSWGDDDPVGIVELPAGPIRMRVNWRGLTDTLTHPDYDLGGDDPSPETVLLQLWPGADHPRLVQRGWSRRAQ